MECHQQKPLWMFLLELLMDEKMESVIRWTSEDGEFKFVAPEQVARLWGLYKNRPRMCYEKMSRGLRYYYDKNIIHKVPGQRFVYKFISIPEHHLGRTEGRRRFLTNSTDSGISVQSSAFDENIEDDDVFATTQSNDSLRIKQEPTESTSSLSKTDRSKITFRPYDLDYTKRTISPGVADLMLPSPSLPFTPPPLSAPPGFFHFNFPANTQLFEYP